jgi:hypothetical protein
MFRLREALRAYASRVPRFQRPRFSQEDQKIRRVDCSPRRSARNEAPDPLAAARTPKFSFFCPSDLPVKISVHPAFLLDSLSCL